MYMVYHVPWCRYRQSRKSALLSSLRGSPNQGCILIGGSDMGSSGGVLGTPEMEKAARDIQRLVRGRLARLQVGPSSKQGRWRDVSSPSCVVATSSRQKEGEEEAAALRIQKIVRGRSVRRRMGPAPQAPAKPLERSQEPPEIRRGSVAKPLSLGPSWDTMMPPERPVTAQNERFGNPAMDGRIAVKFKSRPTTRATSMPASRQGRANLLEDPSSPYARENWLLQRPHRLKQRRDPPREVKGEETVIVPTVVYAGPPPRSPQPPRAGGFNQSYKGAGV